MWDGKQDMRDVQAMQHSPVGEFPLPFSLWYFLLSYAVLTDQSSRFSLLREQHDTTH